jgi:voltage-gated potassium channel
MALLSCVWLAMLVIEMAGRRSLLQERIVTAIWLIFVADFLTRLCSGADNSRTCKQIGRQRFALAVPALRAFRLVRAIRMRRLARAVGAFALFQAR